MRNYDAEGTERAHVVMQVMGKRWWDEGGLHIIMCIVRHSGPSGMPSSGAWPESP
jgi:hypothetical protein